MFNLHELSRRYLAGVELDESRLPNRVLYCGGPLGGAAGKDMQSENSSQVLKQLIEHHELLLLWHNADESGKPINMERLQGGNQVNIYIYIYIKTGSK